ncbi:MAG: VOC family protein [Rhodospirillales bacterium]|nr:VOC family protein [Rhodospirillales bacterium]
MKDVLFLCVANSARSQMAEGLARQAFGDKVRVRSAGSNPTSINPHAVTVLQEIGIDISGHASKRVDDLDTHDVDTVVTLCADEVCPVFLGKVRRIAWPLQDPAKSVVGESEADILERFRKVRDMLKGRIEVLAALQGRPRSVPAHEFHSSIRVNDLARSARFYAWLLDCEPKDITHRFVTFIRADLHLNFVILVNDGMELHHDTLFHLGVAMKDKEAVVEAYHRALEYGAEIHKPPRTTWRGTPLHELWIKDPDGNLIEIYARLTDEELATKPVDEQPVFLVSGTQP